MLPCVHDEPPCPVLPRPLLVPSTLSCPAQPLSLSVGAGRCSREEGERLCRFGPWLSCCRPEMPQRISILWLHQAIRMAACMAVHYAETRQRITTLQNPLGPEHSHKCACKRDALCTQSSRVLLVPSDPYLDQVFLGACSVTRSCAYPNIDITLVSRTKPALLSVRAFTVTVVAN